jgi:hypothetical protein
MSYESPWRSLGETAGNFRNADKSEGNRITCLLSDTTREYHPAIASLGSRSQHQKRRGRGPSTDS